ncbi:hypothetical protein DYB32_008537 [Aphanomyces invadans]|uniref:Myb-like domain-containing protein n=1 Tax=Aphanomyces invadans TaxID=157072 RepID=A0A418AKT5_9STRA|nr:hypothetical protein DYB32_008537 [Aphanomyces invadans]
MSLEESSKLKPAHRFTVQEDIDLLKEVILVRPHDAPYGQTAGRWEEVGDHMRAIHGMTTTTVDCRKRHDDLMVAFKQDTIKSLRASGTEKQNSEQEQLLQDLLGMVRFIHSSLMEEEEAIGDKRVADEHAVREATMRTLKRKAEHLRAQSDDHSTMDFDNKALRGPSMFKDASYAVEFATSLKKSTALKMDEISAQREPNALMAKKLELEERRYELDKAECEARFALEQRGRLAQLEFMQATLEVMRAMAKR